ncbi:hypothetical protein [Nocardioides sp. SYSU D00038]|uniref:hypothetical protein n=1 Tax=Nocardioides sp. SYSU D00038 TaxID=2812554 RepID=UPI001967D50A|nr:hypothetical protein [Nocardioides sp. SYSU D00038]
MPRRAPLAAALVALVAVLLPTAAQAAPPVEPYASYDPETRCSKLVQRGTVVLGRWIVRQHGGSGGATWRRCSSSVSEHQDGRAIDWTMDADDPGDAATVEAFLARVFASDRAGTPHAKARRMGIMYVIWDDRMYAAWEGFEPRPYLSSSCRRVRSCSKTLRHRDHVHVSLSRAGAKGRTSWYRGRL